VQKKTKIILIVCGAVAGLLALVATTLIVGRLLGARRAWKERAVPEIARLAADQKWLAREKAALRSPEPFRESRVIAEGWLSERMILMKSGEWLVYRSHCHKRPPHNVKDIFIARGSDGKWYYSTCHFCVGMITLVMEQDGEPPEDIASFARKYNLREFDGKSDECLKETATAPRSE